MIEFALHVAAMLIGAGLGSGIVMAYARLVLFRKCKTCGHIRFSHYRGMRDCHNCPLGTRHDWNGPFDRAEANR